MSIHPKKFLPLLLILSFMPFAHAAEDFNEQDGEHVRVTRHTNGSRTIFKRYPGQRKLLKRNYDANGILLSITQYIDSPSGQPLSCLIFDGQKNLLFKVRYGYDPKTGRLMQEIMSDAKTNKDVRKFCYSYDSQGKRNTPVCYNLVTPDQMKKNGQHAGATALDSDPFAKPPSSNRN